MEISEKLNQICNEDWHYKKLLKINNEDIVKIDYNSLVKIIKDSKNIVVVTNLTNTDKLLNEFEHKLISNKYKTNNLFNIYNNKDETLFLIYDALLKISGQYITTCIIDLNDLNNYKVYQIDNYIEYPSKDELNKKSSVSIEEFINYAKSITI